MPDTAAYASHGEDQPFKPFTFTAPPLGKSDVRISILYCGVCHSDIHTARNEWGDAKYPVVPGHEIVGTVREVGVNARKFKVGARVGVGCFIDSCGKCDNCRAGEEQMCAEGFTPTYNGQHRVSKQRTYGGYSSEIVVHEDYVLRIPDNLPSERAAPLLCAGITTYAPLKKWGAGPEKTVGVVGLGGLGHVAVKIAVAMGANVTVFSHTESKRRDAENLGAKDFATLKNLDKVKGKLDVILNTVSDKLEWNELLQCLRPDGVFVQLGMPPEGTELKPGSIAPMRYSVTGSMIGGIAQTQEMLDFCGKHEVMSDIELIAPSQINESYERVVRSDVRYRFVIDNSKLGNP